MFATEAHFDQWSPYKAVEAVDQSDPELFMVVGTMGATGELASRFKPLLESTGRDFIYHNSACPHSLSCMILIEAFRTRNASPRPPTAD